MTSPRRKKRQTSSNAPRAGHLVAVPVWFPSGSLARQVVEALVPATQMGQIPSRENFPDSLLDQGAPLIQRR
jgi:hypothetical protein